MNQAMKIKQLATAPSIILGDLQLKKFETVTDEALLAIQAPSTQKLLKMTEEEYLANQQRVISTEGQTTSKTDPKDLDRLVNKGVFDPEQVVIVEGQRRTPKNNQQIPIAPIIDGKRVYDNPSSVTLESKAKAVDAFIYSQPAKLTPEEVTKLTELQKIVELTELPPPAVPEQSLAKRFTHWLWTKGFPVNKFTKKKLSVEEAKKVSE